MHTDKIVPIEIIRKVAKELFPNEEWETFSENEARLVFANRCLPEGIEETDNDGQILIYTGLFQEDNGDIVIFEC